MRINNTLNDTQNTEVSKKPKINFSFKKNGKKIDKSIVIVVSVVLMFFLVIVYIFNLEDPTSQTIDDNSKISEVSQFDVSKINEAQNNKVLAPPPLTAENTNLENQEQNQFDFNKINSLQHDESSNQNLSETQNIKKEIDDLSTFSPTFDAENDELKQKVERLEREIIELKYSNRNINTDKAAKTIDIKVSNSETTVTDIMKDYLTGVKNDIQIKGDYFHLQGKNYYVGDKLNGYDVREIKKSSVRFCSNWCYTLIF